MIYVLAKSIVHCKKSHSLVRRSLYISCRQDCPVTECKKKSMSTGFLFIYCPALLSLCNQDATTQVSESNQIIWKLWNSLDTSLIRQFEHLLSIDLYIGSYCLCLICWVRHDEKVKSSQRQSCQDEESRVPSCVCLMRKHNQLNNKKGSRSRHAAYLTHSHIWELRSFKPKVSEAVCTKQLGEGYRYPKRKTWDLCILCKIQNLGRNAKDLNSISVAAWYDKQVYIEW